MFNNYYVFNKDVDESLKELGFELNKDSLKYEKICKEDSLVVKYEINEKYVTAQRLNAAQGVHSYKFISEIESNTFEEILDKTRKSLDDLNEQFSKTIEYYDLNEVDEVISECKNLRYIEVNSATENSFNKIKTFENKEDEQFGYIKNFTGVPVYLNDKLENNSIKIYY